MRAKRAQNEARYASLVFFALLCENRRYRRAVHRRRRVHF
jgi:hypothetical protein